MADADDFNGPIIEEFRANAGKVGGMFENATLLILHSKGAKSGAERLNPLLYNEADGGSAAIFASAAGADKHPAWYHNLVAEPNVTIEIGAETGVSVKARVTAGDERNRIWTKVKQGFAGMGEYEKMTSREIPVVVLDRV